MNVYYILGIDFSNKKKEIKESFKEDVVLRI